MEQQVADGLAEQQEALGSVEAALLEQPHSAELLQMKEQLEAAVQELQQSLCELRRGQSLAGDSTSTSAQALVPTPTSADQGSPAAGPSSGFAAGSECRFRHTDGCWYSAVVAAVTGTVAQVHWAHPTRQHQLEGAVRVPLAHLAAPRRSSVSVMDLPPGSSVVAHSQPEGLWLPAELQAADPLTGKVQVVFVASGQQATLAAYQVSVSALAAVSDLEGSSASSESGLAQLSASDTGYDSGDSSEGNSAGPVVLWGGAYVATPSATASPQSSQVVPHQAAWEKHTRGVGSALLARMGYVAGQGLGRSGTGTTRPLEVRLLRPGAGLGSQGVQADSKAAADKHGKRRRGGERTRRRKLAQAARAQQEARRDAQHAKQLADGEPGVFGFMNRSLGSRPESGAAPDSRQHSDPSIRHHVPRSAGNSRCAGNEQDRKALTLQGDKVASLHQKAAQLRAMAGRNAGNSKITGLVGERLRGVEAVLAAAQQAQAGAHEAIRQQEKQQRWMKF